MPRSSTMPKVRRPKASGTPGVRHGVQRPLTFRSRACSRTAVASDRRAHAGNRLAVTEREARGHREEVAAPRCDRRRLRPHADRRARDAANAPHDLDFEPNGLGKHAGSAAISLCCMCARIVADPGTKHAKIQNDTMAFVRPVRRLMRIRDIVSDRASQPHFPRPPSSPAGNRKVATRVMAAARCSSRVPTAVRYRREGLVEFALQRFHIDAR